MKGLDLCSGYCNGAPHRSSPFIHDSPGTKIELCGLTPVSFQMIMASHTSRTRTHVKLEPNDSPCVVSQKTRAGSFQPSPLPLSCDLFDWLPAHQLSSRTILPPQELPTYRAARPSTIPGRLSHFGPSTAKASLFGNSRGTFPCSPAYTLPRNSTHVSMTQDQCITLCIRLAIDSSYDDAVLTTARGS